MRKLKILGYLLLYVAIFICGYYIATKAMISEYLELVVTLATAEAVIITLIEVNTNRRDTQVQISLVKKQLQQNQEQIELVKKQLQIEQEPYVVGKGKFTGDKPELLIENIGRGSAYQINVTKTSFYCPLPSLNLTNAESSVWVLSTLKKCPLDVKEIKIGYSDQLGNHYQTNIVIEKTNGVFTVVSNEVMKL